MSEETRPTLQEFLAAPDDVVAAVAPATALWAPGGTRRQAAREGIQLDEAYVDWAGPQLLTAFDLFFRLGIRNLILAGLGPHQFADVGHYRERMISWTIRGLAGPPMIREYRRHNWRARLITPSPVPALHETAATLARETPEGQHTLWLSCIADHGDPWQEILAAVQRTGAQTYQEALYAVYGEEIVPASLLVGFGKPTLGTSLLPPLLCGPDLHCYWTQQAGFRISAPMLRTILYDYAYSRRTWHAGRHAHFDQPAHEALWDTTQIVGVGAQVSGFWYPASFPGPQLEDQAEIL